MNVCHHRFTLARPATLGALLALLLPIAVAAESQQSATQQKVERQKTDGAGQSGMKVDLDDLEERSSQYIGKRVTVTGEVQNVLGPRLFTVDEENWIDFDGETLVLVPAPAIAFVREDRPVTITGTVRRFVKADIEHEWGWFNDQPRIEAEFTNRPVLVADSVTSVGDNAAVMMTFDRTGNASSPSRGQPSQASTTSPGQSSTPQTGQTTTRTEQTTSAQRGQPMTDLSELARTTDERLIGRMVNLQNAKVSSTVAMGGFWITSDDERLFVLPTDGTKVQQGQQVSIMGTVLELPNQMKDRLDKGTAAQDEEIYVYATQVKQVG
jgi:hypothetical protein